VITVDIDIKPAGDPNAINPKSRGVAPVAILGSSDFDVTDVDISSIQFAGAPVATQRNRTLASLEDVNGDSYLDLVMQFRVQDTDISPGDTEACLTGQTFAGQALEGCDSIRTPSDANPGGGG
jgi:hypothetical protein